MSISTVHKCAAALRYLEYSVAFDASDEYLKISKTTAIEYVDYFCTYMYKVFY